MKTVMLALVMLVAAPGLAPAQTAGTKAPAAGGVPSVILIFPLEAATLFPNGALRMEAAALRVRALSEAGRTGEASRQASRLVQKDPNGVLASRLRRYVQP